MSIQPDVDLQPFWDPQIVLQNSDAELSFSFFQSNGAVYDLTGATVEVVVKPSRHESDATGTTYSATITSPPTLGQATLTIPAADLSTPGVQWYHVDILGSGGSRIIVNIGPFDIQAA